VTNGGEDGSKEALGSLELPFPLTVLEQVAPGAAAARNHGVGAAAGELLLFLDDDMIASSSLLTEHDRSHRDGAAAVVGHLPLHPDSPPWFISAAVADWAEERGRRLATAKRIQEVGDIVTGQLSLARELFLELGGFDTRFRGFGNEDLDLGRRLLDGNHRVVFNEHAVTEQLYVVTPSAYLRQRRELGAADVLLARKHPELARRSERSPETRRDRALRPLLPMLRAVALTAVALSPHGVRARRWFFRARRREYLAGVRAAGGLPARHPVRVVCYHSISERRGDAVAEYCVSPREFRSQIAFLARRYRPISGSELLRLLDGSGGVPHRAVLVTFDDCYRDLLTTALPVLSALEVPALAFAVTQRIGTANEWDARLGGVPLQLLDQRGLKTLAERGVELGAHSRTHAKLTGLSDEQLAEELAGAADDLDALGVGGLRILAYPYGVHDERVRRAAAASYRAAFTVEPGIVDAEGADRYALPRIEITARDRGIRFRWKLARAHRRRGRDVGWNAPDTALH
jgi:peptidoglycan/xylan/chitin deacetylase (PgdA/CDA1 family)